MISNILFSTLIDLKIKLVLEESVSVCALLSFFNSVYNTVLDLFVFNYQFGKQFEVGINNIGG
jgi:hypothetical protein